MAEAKKATSAKAKPKAAKTKARAAATKPPAKAKDAAAASAQRPAMQAPAGGACPRCGTPKFAAEQRTRVEGDRTVRYTILVCERGHTFAKPSVPSR